MDLFNIIIRNGRIFDGTNNPWYKADVGLIGETISFIGDLEGIESLTEIDANGLCICPGFIDIHSHGDVNFFVNHNADSKIMQGVTTEIVGNCGISTAPVTELGKRFLNKRYEDLEINWDWNTVSEYFERLESIGIPLNVGTFIGQEAVRCSIMGFENRDPTKAELEDMKKLVEDGIKDGAFGFSIMLKGAPGVYSKHNEIIEICKVVQKLGGIYATHQKTQGDTLIESIEESIDIGRKSGIPVHISHLKVKGRRNWGKSKYALKMIDDARDCDIDVTFDQYPYNVSGGWVGMPSWALEGGMDQLFERLRDPKTREKIEEGIREHEDWGVGPDNLHISMYPPNPSYEGKSLAELGEHTNKSPESVWCDLLLKAGRRPRIIKYSMWEEEVQAIMTHHAMMVGSDASSLANYGVLGRGKPHPRNYGTFPRFLGRYVVRGGLMSLEDGVRRITSNPARRLGLNRRGLILENMYADIVVFDPKKIIDIATLENPHQYPEGIKHVLVNGTLAVKDGKYTGQRAGRPLRHRTRSKAGSCA